jgi:hypothetical protein
LLLQRLYDYSLDQFLLQLFEYQFHLSPETAANKCT